MTAQVDFIEGFLHMTYFRVVVGGGVIYATVSPSPPSRPFLSELAIICNRLQWSHQFKIPVIL